MLNILSALWKTEEEEKTAFLFLLVELEKEEELLFTRSEIYCFISEIKSYSGVRFSVIPEGWRSFNISSTLKLSKQRISG